MNGAWRIGVAAAAVVIGVSAAIWAVLVAVTDILGASDWSEAGTVQWLAIPGVGGAALAALSTTRLRRADELIEDLPPRSYLPSLAGLAGVTLGAAAAALTPGNAAVRIVAAVVCVAAAAVAVRRALLLRDEIRTTREERLSITRLREHGRLVRAEVVEAVYSLVMVDALLMFEVTAEYTGRFDVHRVRHRLLTSIDDVPVVGGTVLLWVAADGSDPTDVFMETDPDSIRHPNPAEFLPAPGLESGGFRGLA